MVLGATLAGSHQFAISFRRQLAPTLAVRPGMSWGILGGAYLLLVLWGPTHALRTVWGVLLLAGLVAPAPSNPSGGNGSEPTGSPRRRRIARQDRR
jgi:hypothetical protein